MRITKVSEKESWKYNERSRGPSCHPSLLTESSSSILESGTISGNNEDVVLSYVGVM